MGTTLRTRTGDEAKRSRSSRSWLWSCSTTSRRRPTIAAARTRRAVDSSFASGGAPFMASTARGESNTARPSAPRCRLLGNIGGAKRLPNRVSARQGDSGCSGWVATPCRSFSVATVPARSARLRSARGSSCVRLGALTRGAAGAPPRGSRRRGRSRCLPRTQRSRCRRSRWGRARARRCRSVEEGELDPVPIGGIGETPVCGPASAGPSGARTQGGRIAALMSIRFRQVPCLTSSCGPARLPTHHRGVPRAVPRRSSLPGSIWPNPGGLRATAVPPAAAIAPGSWSAATSGSAPTATTRPR